MNRLNVCYVKYCLYFCSKVTIIDKYSKMIRDFWVKNYLSIRDKQELSFVAKGPSSELVSEVAEGVFLYKLGILYGSNASGKSNMLEVFRILVIPKSEATKRIDSSIPFILTKNDPIEMHVSFYANAIRYDYDVSFNEKCILKEVLYYYPNKSKSLFYERSFVNRWSSESRSQTCLDYAES